MSTEFISLTASGVEAVSEPGSSGLNAPQLLAQGEGVKKYMGRVGRVPHDAGRTASKVEERLFNASQQIFKIQDVFRGFSCAAQTPP